MELIEKNPKVSVCVVTYNQEKYIRQCLQSIVDQETDFDFEVIVGDDCSTDGTRAIIQVFVNKYPEIVKPLFHEKNIGASKNYLSVHGAATGDYLSHIDGDDFALANKLSKQVEYLDKNSDCIAVVHKLAIFNSASEPTLKFWPNLFHYEKYDLANLVRNHPAFGNSSLMYRRKACSSLIEISPPKLLDFYIYIHLASQGKIGVINEVLGCYTAGVGVSTSQSFHELAIDSLNYAKKLGLPKKLWKFSMARQFLLFAKKAILEKNYSLFSSLISNSINFRIISVGQLVLYLFRSRPSLILFIYNLIKSMRDKYKF